MRRFRFAITIPMLLLVFLPLARGADDVDTILEKLYASPYEAAGDYDLFVKELEQLFKDNMRSPAAQVIYHRMNILLKYSQDPTLLDGFFADLAKLGGERGMANGLLATRARLDFRDVLLRKGQYQEAKDLKAFNTFSKKILAIGPFGFNTSSLHDIAFPPELILRELKTYKGYAGEVSWRLIERESDQALFNLGDHLYPRAGCAYALYQFESSDPTQILLHFFTSGSAKIWFNGMLIEDLDRRKTYLPSVFRVPLFAAKGWSRVLVKLQTNQTFSLRITDRAGYPLRGLKEMQEAKLHPLSPDAFKKVEEFDQGRIDGLAFLRSHAALHADNPNAHLALADFLAYQGMDSNAIAMAEQAKALAPKSAHPLYFLGTLYRDAAYLPRNYRTNRAKTSFKEALEINQEFLPARLALAMIDHENDRSEEAIETIGAILEKNARYYKARSALIAIFEKMEWDKERLETIREAVKLAVSNPEPQMLLARYYRDLDRDDLAFELYQRALDLDRSRLDVLERIAAYLWDRGERAKAFGLYESIFDLNRSDLNRVRLADLHRALGDPVKAKEIYESLQQAHPKNPLFDAKLGDLTLTLDGWKKASEWYKLALEKAPDQHILRKILEDWDVLKDPLFEEFAVKEEDHLLNLPGKEEFPKASAICALDQMITRIYPDGSRKSEIHQIIKILDKDAVEEFGRLPVPGRIEVLKVIQPDGRILVPMDVEGQDVFNIPGLDVGSVLVLKHTLYMMGSLGTTLRLGGFYFQDVNSTKPFLFSRFVLAVPAGLDLKIKRTLPSGFEEERFDRNGDTVHVFTARNAPVAEQENMMPPPEKAFPNVTCYQSSRWDFVAERFANNLFPALRPTREITAKVEKITEEGDSDLEKARKIYAFVNEHVKEDRGSSEATRVLLEGQGSRVNLFMALLNAAQVRFDYLRCGLNSGYLPIPPDWTDVSQSLFTSALIRLRPRGDDPALLSFFSRLTPFGEIPPALFNAPAMPVTGYPERIETLPGGDPAAWLDQVTKIEIKVDGRDARIQGIFKLPGYSRTSFRERLERMDAHERKNFFEYNILRGIFPGARLIDLKIRGIDDGEAPPTLVFELEAKDFIQPVAGREGLKLIPVPMELTRMLIRKGKRTFPMVYRGRSTTRYTVDIDFGGAYQVEELPESLVDRRFFLNYALIATRTDAGVRVERTAELLPADMEPDQYLDLVEMLGAIDEREKEPIVLKRTAERAPPEPEEKSEAAPAPVKKGS